MVAGRGTDASDESPKGWSHPSSRLCAIPTLFCGLVMVSTGAQAEAVYNSFFHYPIYGGKITTAEPMAFAAAA